MAYTRLTAIWTGFTGAPGYSRFRFTEDLTAGECATAAAAVRGMFDTIKGYLPNTVTVTIEPEAQQYNINNVLIGSVPFTAPAAVTGTQTSVYSAASGAVVRWLTPGVYNGRKVAGRTFFVPLAAAAYENNGSLDYGFLIALNNAAAMMLNLATPFVIVSNSPTGTVGAISNVTGKAITDKAAVLRSRRD